MRDYAGDFETHLTVRAGGAADLDAFQAWCAERDFKCVRIVLARGAHVEQPMATWRRANTVLRAVRDEAALLAAQLASQGFAVVRTKIEAAPHNAQLPQTDADALGEPDARYFEHHVKLLRRVDAPREPLSQVCQRHGAHLSRNAFRPAVAGREERFVTLRAYGVGRRTSEARLAALLSDLSELGEHVLEQESEYCVFDSNLELDAGWLNDSPPSVP